MKIFLILLTAAVLNQSVFAIGASGDDPNSAKSESSTSEAGSVATAAVAANGQPKVCTTCMTAGHASMSNTAGVLNSTNASSVAPSSSSGPTSTSK